MLASGLYGIERTLSLPAKLDGNAYAAATMKQALTSGEAQTLPRNLTVATDLLEQSDVAREFFGKDFVEHFVATRRWEVSEYEKTVTSWERRRYFELI